MRILLTGAFKYSEEQLNRIKRLGYEIAFIQDERIPLDKQLLNFDISEIEAVICNRLFLYSDITEFKNLKFIQLTSAGVDRVLLDYIKEHVILLSNARAVYNVPMAEWAVLKILEIYKQSRFFYRVQREKQWVKNREILELTGKTVAIIGFGNVGREIAKRLKTFGVNIIGVGRKEVRSEFVDLAYLITDIDNVLSKSDVVILTLPLTDDTYHLINKNRLAVMKEDSVLINLSRGAVVHEEDLIKELERGKFLGVALDVFEQEPLPDSSRLWEFKNVIITPHNSFFSDMVNERLFEVIMKNLKDYIKSCD